MFFFFFQAEDGIRDRDVTGVQTCALPIFEGEARKLDRQFGRYGAQAEGPNQGTEIVNLRRIQALPLLLSGILSLAAAAAVAHMLVTSVRRRRRDLAVLKTL